MAGNTKKIVRDADNLPAPQYYNPTTDAYEYAQGASGGLNVNNYIQTAGGLWVPQKGSDDGAAHVQLTGSNVEQTIGSAIPNRALMMGISDGTNMQALHGNVQGTLLTSAARTGSQITPTQINHNARGVLLTLDVTGNPGGAESLSLLLQNIDPVTGKANTVGKEGSFITAANGTRSYLVYPGAIETVDAVELSVQGIALPRRWRVAVVPSNTASSWTYSLGYSLIL